MPELKKDINKPFRDLKSDIYWNSFLEINDPGGISKLLNSFQEKYNVEEIKEISSSPQYLDYICYYQDNPITIIIAYYNKTNNTGEVIIETCVFFPDFRQIKYGEKIFKLFFNKLWEQGVNTVTIDINNNNEFLLELCQSLGFKSIVV